MTLAGHEQILTVNQPAVSGHDPVTGERLWRAEWREPGERVTPPLQLGDDRILVSGGQTNLAAPGTADLVGVTSFDIGHPSLSPFASVNSSASTAL